MDLLVQRARRQDKTAFIQLMEKHKSSMYKVARAILKNDEDVADAMQETILTCWEKIHTLRQDAYFKTWLTRILINHCNAMYRKRQLCVAEVQEEGGTEHGYCDVEWKVVLNALEEKYRLLIVLYYVEGFKSREIADMLGIKESTVRTRIARAREQLEMQYKR